MTIEGLENNGNNSDHLNAENIAVDFYLLSEASISNSYLFLCKLVDKIYLQRKSIYILANSLDEASTLDDLIWTFRDDAFIPHALLGASNEEILIGTNTDPQHPAEVIINLTSKIFTSSTALRILEIIPQDQREIGRKKYRSYREKNYILNTHDLSK